MSDDVEGYIVPRYLKPDDLLLPGDVVEHRPAVVERHEPYGPERDPLAVLRDAIDKLVRPRVTVFVPEGTPDDVIAACRTLPTVRLVEASSLIPSGEAWVFDPEALAQTGLPLVHANPIDDPDEVVPVWLCELGNHAECDGYACPCCASGECPGTTT